jgi:hypothetical protein
MSAHTTDFRFGDLTVRVQGLGVYFGGPHLEAKCDALSLDALRQANREAWKQRKASDRAANRVCNVSVYGHGPYEKASLHSNVAEVVCKATWKRIAKAEKA